MPVESPRSYMERQQSTRARGNAVDWEPEGVSTLISVFEGVLSVAKGRAGLCKEVHRLYRFEANEHNLTPRNELAVAKKIRALGHAVHQSENSALQITSEDFERARECFRRYRLLPRFKKVHNGVQVPTHEDLQRLRRVAAQQPNAGPLDIQPASAAIQDLTATPSSQSMPQNQVDAEPDYMHTAHCTPAEPSASQQLTPRMRNDLIFLRQYFLRLSQMSIEELQHNSSLLSDCLQRQLLLCPLAVAQNPNNLYKIEDLELVLASQQVRSTLLAYLIQKLLSVGHLSGDIDSQVFMLQFDIFDTQQEFELSSLQMNYVNAYTIRGGEFKSVFISAYEHSDDIMRSEHPEIQHERQENELEGMFEYELNAPEHRFLALFGRSSIPLGFVVFKLWGVGMLYVSSLVVHRDYKQCELGTKMVARLWLDYPHLELCGLVRKYNEVSKQFCTSRGAERWTDIGSWPDELLSPKEQHYDGFVMHRHKA